MKEVQEVLERLVTLLKDTDTFKNYEIQKQKMQEFPELKHQVDEYREKYYLFLQNADGDRIFEETENFLQESDRLRSNSQVNDFLKAELDYCKMTQNVTDYILQEMSVDFE